MLSCAVWGRSLAKQSVEFRCDNHSLVDAIAKGSSKQNMVMHLLRSLWLFTAIFDIDVTASHIPGAQNTSADLLSRNNSKNLLLMNPLASQTPTPLPPALTFLISPTQPDWTSPSFQHNLRAVLHTTLT